MRQPLKTSLIGIEIRMPPVVAAGVEQSGTLNIELDLTRPFTTEHCETNCFPFPHPLHALTISPFTVSLSTLIVPHSSLCYFLATAQYLNSDFSTLNPLLL